MPLKFAETIRPVWCRHAGFRFQLCGSGFLSFPESSYTCGAPRLLLFAWQRPRLFHRCTEFGSEPSRRFWQRINGRRQPAFGNRSPKAGKA
jgi:hypothetical protein